MTILLPIKKRPTLLQIDDGGSSGLLVEESRPMVETWGGSATHLSQLRLLESDSMTHKTEGSKENSATVVSEKTKTGLMIVLKRKRVSGGDSMWELGGNSENKKPKTIKSGKSICFKEEDEPVPRDLEKLIKGKGGRDIRMVIRKKLTKTDIMKQQARLLIPHNQMEKGVCFLTEEEKATVNSKVKGSNEIRVRVMEPCGLESEMVLVKWSMQTSDNYSLRTGWNDAVTRNHLEANQFIQLWSFRIGSQLWFAIDADAASSSSSPSSDSCGEPLLKYVTVLSDTVGVVRKKRSNRMRNKAATTDLDDEKEEAEVASCLLLLSRGSGESVYPNQIEGIELLINLLEETKA